MIARTLLRLAARVPGVAGDISDWYDEMRAIAATAAVQRAEDEARITTDPQDMGRWLKEPEQRRPAPKGGPRQ